MRAARKYRLKLERWQSRLIDQWIELCRRQYNFRLGERFRWYEATRTPVNACPLTSSIVPIADIYRDIPETKILKKGKNKGAEVALINEGYVRWDSVQKDDLKRTKTLFPEYKAMPSQVLQDVIKRLDKTFSNFTVGDKNGKRSGRPKFKGKPHYRSICFPQSVELTDNGKIELPKVGVLDFIEHRPIPDGFTVKTATIKHETDGYFLTLSLEDKSVPVVEVNTLPTDENSKGIDLGLEFFSSGSDGVQIENSRWFRKSEKRIAKLQQRKARKPHGCYARKVLAKKIAKLQTRVARARLDWQYKTAHKLFKDCEVIFCEDLSLKNLIRRNRPKIENGKFVPNGQAAKSGLNKSLTDAALGQFVRVLKWVAFKLGKRVIQIDPRGTSQHCHACLNKTPKSLKNRWHECYHCGESLPRDVNSGKLIKRIGLLAVGMDSASLKTALTCVSNETLTTKQSSLKEARALSFA
ncbi:transposase, IS605 family [Synechococcus sp. PCC 7335]|uniref:RNA-guided endonuclease InsQ/TnpB family protein n=1 Tax=Synechococcus sp. (strain ATCC 29403 / PCC 7335) TaxID=91464 RepID=UPI00017EE4B9|nr:RNA-guided endonuclease TnpB family protein [Synechococcus sp. PCC 7335]EDX82555.1 transposase, IS605 family [Synechococcus sp. PCC 7335]